MNSRKFSYFKTHKKLSCAEHALRDSRGAVLPGVRSVTAQVNAEPLCEPTVPGRSDGRVCGNRFCCRRLKADWDVKTGNETVEMMMM